MIRCDSRFLSHFLDVINVVKRRERLDYLFVGLVFLELLTAYGECHGKYAQPRTRIGLICLDIVDPQPQPPADGDKIPKIFTAFKLKVNLKVI